MAGTIMGRPDASSEPRALVVGGAGFIGSNLVAALTAAGWRITVLDNFSTGRREHLPADPSLRVVEADLRTCAGLGALVAEADYVFHLAAQVGNVKSLTETLADAETNILGTVRLLEACRDHAVRKLVVSASSAGFGEAAYLPIDEAHPQRPASFYALSKLTAEQYARLAQQHWGVPAVCLRYFNVFGLPLQASEYASVIAIFIDRLRRGLPLVVYGDGEQFRDFVYVGDVVQANRLAALHGPPGAVYNIGTGVRTTVNHLITVLAELTDSRPEVRYEAFRPSEVRHSVADITRARAELGYNPAWDLRRGLDQLLRGLAAGG